MNRLETIVKEALTNPAAAWTTATATASSAIGAKLNLLPENLLVNMATIIGMSLSLVMIFTHIKKYFNNKKDRKLKAEIDRQDLINAKLRTEKLELEIQDLKKD